MRRITVKLLEPLAAESLPAEVALPPREARHVRDVLRLAVGQAVVVADGGGRHWAGTLSAVTPSAVRVALCGGPAEAAQPQPVTLAVALVKQGFDRIVRQAVELGVRRLVPLRTAFTCGGLAAKAGRWRRIAAEAEKQSGRAGLLEICEVTDVAAFAAQAGAGPGVGGRFVADPEAGEALLAAAGRAGPPYTIVIGPEGGLSADEGAALERAGFAAASLGEATLRTDTAVAAAAAILGELARSARGAGRHP